MKNQIDQGIKCTFCGKKNNVVKQMLTSKKGNICYDCIEFAYNVIHNKIPETTNINLKEVVPKQTQTMPYVCYFDGSSKGNPGAGNCGFAVLVDGKLLKKDSKPLGHSTNNEAEYHGLIFLLDYLISISASNVQINGDSLLVVNQISGKWKVKSKTLRPLHQDVNVLLAKISNWSLQWIPREENSIADNLAQNGM